MPESGPVLKQQNSPGSYIKVKLLDGRELQVTSKNKKTKHVYSVDILSLQDKSKSTFLIAWKWLVTSILFFLLMLVLLKVLPAYLQTNKNLYLGGILLVGLLGGFVSLILFWMCSSRKQIFYSRNAGVPIIILNAGKPSKKVFSSFIDMVEQRIIKFRNHMHLSEEKQLTGEMKMLRRLSDDGIIRKKDYEAAKSKLFSGFDSNFINRDSK